MHLWGANRTEKRPSQATVRNVTKIGEHYAGRQGLPIMRIGETGIHRLSKRRYDPIPWRNVVSVTNAI
jgi:hypothetical protein